MAELIYMIVAGSACWLGGFYIGRTSANDNATLDRLERKIDAHDAATRADTDEAWDVFEAAFPKETNL